jgi:trigger factor
MQISLTATGGLERRLEVAVPAQRVDSEIDQRLKKLSRTARLKGFRPGKAPLQVIQKQFGEQVRAEVVGDLMRSTFAEAISQERLRPAGGPRIEPLSVERGGDLKYAAVFEVLPEVKLKPVEGLSVERPTAEVTDADVDAMVESMRKQRPVFTAVERAVADTDRVTIDYHMHAEAASEEAHKHDQDADFVVGAGRVPSELNEAVKGLTVGESRGITLPLPADPSAPQLQGRSAEMHFTVKKVEAQSLPALDEEFMKAFGVSDGNLETLRAEVRESMAREVGNLSRERVRTQVMDALYRDNAIEVPRALLEEQVQQLQLDMGRRIGARDVSQLPAREGFIEPARRRVTLGLLLGSIVGSAGLKPDRQRILDRVNEISAAYPNPDEVRRNYLQNAEAMRSIESSVLEDQALDWILERAKISDKAMSFSELTGFGRTTPGNTTPEQPT